MVDSCREAKTGGRVPPGGPLTRLLSAILVNNSSKAQAVEKEENPRNGNLGVCIVCPVCCPHRLAPFGFSSTFLVSALSFLFFLSHSSLPTRMSLKCRGSLCN